MVQYFEGAVGFTENNLSFRKCRVSGPEQARLLKEFEQEYFLTEENSECGYHHKEGLSTHVTQVIRQVGNLFLDGSDNLLALDTHNILDESVVNTVRTIHSRGKGQYDK